ncbi:type VI secretion system baseplate subunit TssF [Caballeronia sp. CLC5]|nr:type VI secretion system baseplate subunit TssF [Caballeronia sp. CLC5]
MDSDFLTLYNQEAVYMRELAGEFARLYPKIGRRLGMQVEGDIGDAYVEKLIESFSFVAARTQSKLNGAFPAFTGPLLETIYPNFNAPTPAVAVARFYPGQFEGKAGAGFRIARGTTFTSAVLPGEQSQCVFVSSQDVTLYPLEIVSAQFTGIPAIPSLERRLPEHSQIKGALRLRLRAGDCDISSLQDLDRLPIYLTGDEALASRLFELLHVAALATVIGEPGQLGQGDASFHVVTREAVVHEALEPDQGLLPLNWSKFNGLNLIQEAFSFANRFYFFTLTGLGRGLREIAEREVEIVVLLSQSAHELADQVDASHFSLFCTPVINLFPLEIDSLELSTQKLRVQADHELLMRPAPLLPMDYEVFRIDRLCGHLEANSEKLEFKPRYHALNHDEGSHGRYYTIRRAEREETDPTRRYGNRYYAYANQSDAAADGRGFVRNAWVTLTTDSDWVARGWQAYDDKDLNGADDAFIEDDDAVMRKILDAAHKSTAALNLDDLHSEGVDAILRNVAVRFHTEWDSDVATKRYQKLKTGEHPPLPQFTDAQFSAFIQDSGKQQFWGDARVRTDGVNGPALTPLDSRMKPQNWHFHPIGFLAQMRECLTTDAALSEEAFETEIRRNWITGLKFIEKRLEQIEPWKNPNNLLPSPPAQLPVVLREYATTHAIQNRRHTTFWENFIYWFGVDPNTIVTPETNNLPRDAAPAGHHVYVYMKGMRDAFKHISMQQVLKAALGFEAGAYVWQGRRPERPPVPAQGQFQMECVNIACQHGLFFKRFVRTDPVDQNRMQVQLHEISHMVGTTCSDDKKVTLPDGTVDPRGFKNSTAYGAEAARVLAEFHPEHALANAENVAFFIVSAKDEVAGDGKNNPNVRQQA